MSAFELVPVERCRFAKIGAVQFCDPAFTALSDTFTQSLSRTNNLLAVSNRYGLLVTVAARDTPSVYVARTNKVLESILDDRRAQTEQHDAENESAKITDAAADNTVFSCLSLAPAITEPVTHLSFNDSETLLLVIAGKRIAVYDTKTLASAQSETAVTPRSVINIGGTVIHCQWCGSQRVWLLTTDGTLACHDPTSTTDTPFAFTHSDRVTAFALLSNHWMLIGTVSGSLALGQVSVTVTGKPEKISITQQVERHSPASEVELPNQPMVGSITVINDELAVIGYAVPTDGDESKDPDRVALSLFNYTTNEWQDYGDILHDDDRLPTIADTSPYSARHYYHTLSLAARHWQCALVYSNRAYDIRVIGPTSTDTLTNSVTDWLPWEFPSEADGVQVPLDGEWNDTYALGGAIDTSNEVLPNNDVKHHMPAFFMLTSDGRLHAYSFIVNDSAAASQELSEVMKQPSVTIEEFKPDSVPASVPHSTAATAAPKSFAALAAAQSALGWECPICEVRNKPNTSKCAACETPNPDAKPQLDGHVSKGEDAAAKFFFGVPAATASVAVPAPAPKTFAQLAATQTGWECPQCETRNRDIETKCGACEEPKPGSSASQEPSKSAADAAQKFSFGVSSTATTSSATTFSFGAPAAAFTPVPAAGGFGFGLGSTASRSAVPAIFSFGKPTAGASAVTPASSGVSSVAPGGFSLAQHAESPVSASSTSLGASTTHTFNSNEPSNYTDDMRPAAAAGNGFNFGALGAKLAAKSPTPTPAPTAAKPAAAPAFSFGTLPPAAKSPASAPTATPGSNNNAAHAFIFGVDTGKPPIPRSTSAASQSQSRQSHLSEPPTKKPASPVKRPALAQLEQQPQSQRADPFESSKFRVAYSQAPVVPPMDTKLVAPLALRSMMQPADFNPRNKRGSEQIVHEALQQLAQQMTELSQLQSESQSSLKRVYQMRSNSVDDNQSFSVHRLYQFTSKVRDLATEVQSLQSSKNAIATDIDTINASLIDIRRSIEQYEAWESVKSSDDYYRLVAVFPLDQQSAALLAKINRQFGVLNRSLDELDDYLSRQWAALRTDTGYQQRHYNARSINYRQIASIIDNHQRIIQAQRKEIERLSNQYDEVRERSERRLSRQAASYNGSDKGDDRRLRSYLFNESPMRDRLGRRELTVSAANGSDTRSRLTAKTPIIASTLAQLGSVSRSSNTPPSASPIRFPRTSPAAVPPTPLSSADVSQLAASFHEKVEMSNERESRPSTSRATPVTDRRSQERVSALLNEADAPHFQTQSYLSPLPSAALFKSASKSAAASPSSNRVTRPRPLTFASPSPPLPESKKVESPPVKTAPPLAKPFGQFASEAPLKFDAQSPARISTITPSPGPVTTAPPAFSFASMGTSSVLNKPALNFGVAADSERARALNEIAPKQARTTSASAETKATAPAAKPNSPQPAFVLPPSPSLKGDSLLLPVDPAAFSFTGQAPTLGGFGKPAATATAPASAPLLTPTPKLAAAKPTAEVPLSQPASAAETKPAPMPAATAVATSEPKPFITTVPLPAVLLTATPGFNFSGAIPSFGAKATPVADTTSATADDIVSTTAAATTSISAQGTSSTITSTSFATAPSSNAASSLSSSTAPALSFGSLTPSAPTTSTAPSTSSVTTTLPSFGFGLSASSTSSSTDASKSNTGSGFGFGSFGSALNGSSAQSSSGFAINSTPSTPPSTATTGVGGLPSFGELSFGSSTQTSGSATASSPFGGFALPSAAATPQPNAALGGLFNKQPSFGTPASGSGTVSFTSMLGTQSSPQQSPSSFGSTFTQISAPVSSNPFASTQPLPFAATAPAASLSTPPANSFAAASSNPFGAAAAASPFGGAGFSGGFGSSFSAAAFGGGGSAPSTAMPAFGQSFGSSFGSAAPAFGSNAFGSSPSLPQQPVFGSAASHQPGAVSGFGALASSGGGFGGLVQAAQQATGGGGSGWGSGLSNVSTPSFSGSFGQMRG